MASHGKAFIVGEFGLASAQAYKLLLDEVLVGPFAGALLWSLRFHSRDGGFCEFLWTVMIEGIC